MTVSLTLTLSVTVFIEASFLEHRRCARSGASTFDWCNTLRAIWPVTWQSNSDDMHLQLCEYLQAADNPARDIFWVALFDHVRHGSGEYEYADQSNGAETAWARRDRHAKALALLRTQPLDVADMILASPLAGARDMRLSQVLAALPPDLHEAAVCGHFGSQGWAVDIGTSPVSRRLLQLIGRSGRVKFVRLNDWRSRARRNMSRHDPVQNFDEWYAATPGCGLTSARELTGIQVSGVPCKALSEALPHWRGLSQLRSLHLTEVRDCRAALPDVAASIATLQLLTELTFSCEISPLLLALNVAEHRRHVAALFAAIASLRMLEALSVSQFDLVDQIAASFASCVAALPHLRSLSVTDTEVDAELSAAIAACTGVSALDLNSTGLFLAEPESVGASLATLRQLQSLDVSNNSVLPDGICDIFVQALAQLKQLTALDMSDSWVGSAKALTTFAACVAMLPCLRQLRLGFCEYDASVCALLDALASMRSLTELMLWDMPVTAEDLSRLPAWFVSMSGLCTLVLSMNQSGDSLDSLPRVAPQLACEPPSLRNLSLSGVPSSACVLQLPPVVLSRLHDFDLWFEGCASASSQAAVTACIGHMTQLTRLRLKYDHEEGKRASVMMLASCLAELTGLQALHVDQWDGFEGQHAAKLADALRGLQSLTALTMLRCNIAQAEARVLAQAMFSLPRLQHATVKAGNPGFSDLAALAKPASVVARGLVVQ